MVINGRIMKWYLCFTYTFVSVMSFLFELEQILRAE